MAFGRSPEIKVFIEENERKKEETKNTAKGRGNLTAFAFLSPRVVHRIILQA